MKPEYYKNLFNQVDFAIAEHEMIYDEVGSPTDYRFIYVNKAFCVSLNMKEEEIVGNPSEFKNA